MSLLSPHRAVCPYRKLIAAAMMAIYLVIALSPLSTLAMQSKRVAHAVTGECAGDCEICGCSAESRASRTCCCWRKRQQQCGMPEQGETCATRPETVASPTKQPEVERGCCAGKKKQQNHEMGHHTSRKGKGTQTPVYKCGCPCGSNKLLALWGSFNNEIVLFRFEGDIQSPTEVATFRRFSPSLTSRHDDPPDPPPKLRTLS